jgi:hypothetical protein
MGVALHRPLTKHRCPTENVVTFTPVTVRASVVCGSENFAVGVDTGREIQHATLFETYVKIFNTPFPFGNQPYLLLL